MTCYDDIATRWLDVMFDRTDKPIFRRGQHRVFADGDSIYSYGMHFEMARIVRDANDNPSFFLINGDRYSVTTSGHQSIVRNVIARETSRSGLRSIIVPYAALQAASIDFTTIEPIDITPDRNEVTYHESNDPPPRAEWQVYWNYADVDLTTEELQAKVDKRNTDALESYERECGYRDKAIAAGKLDDFWVEYAPKVPPTPITVDDLSDHERVHHQVRQDVQDVVMRAGYNKVDVTANEDGTLTYRWETTRHWLGESLLRARIRWAGRTTCKPCRGTGTHPDLQGPPEPTVRVVWDREARDDVQVVSPGTRGAGFRFERDSMCQTCRGRGSKPFTRSRLAYFLSGFDMQESRPLYFFCELPQGVAPESVDEAYEALKPTPVKIAEMMEREIVRQGDIFAIPLTNLDKRSLRKQGARFEKRGNLLGTNHEATEVGYLPDGTTVVRGVLYHNPEWRRPDHVRRKLAKGWNVVVKNTVPVAA